jgi:hypothetical protein
MGSWAEPIAYVRHVPWCEPRNTMASGKAKPAFSAVSRSEAVRTGATPQHCDRWALMWQTRLTDTVHTCCDALVQFQ